jgi:protein TonB
MEIKKSPKASLENKKSVSILIGLVVALGLTFVAFELSEVKKEESKAFKEEAKVMVEDEDMMESTHQEEPQKPELPPPPQEKILSEVIEVQENDAEVEEYEFNSEDDVDTAIEIQAPPPPPEEDEEQIIHVIVEKMPEFPGGPAEMNRYLARNIRYPLIAQENGIQGRVYCQFVVNTDGSIVDIKVTRGVEASLDAEAIRVIKSMPKWTPGRQGGKAVRCRFNLPIRFKLQ